MSQTSHPSKRQPKKASINQAPSQRSKVKQAPKRGIYDKQTIYQVVDQAIIATVSIAIGDEPFALPMAIARIDNKVYLHGSRTSRLIKHLAAGNEACICITHLDGIVVARSGMHCSANYRSVVIHGSGEVVGDAEKPALLHQITHRIIPGSEGDFRDHLAKELKATSLIGFSLDESACKIRTGGPIDDAADLKLPHWSGVIPVERVFGAPIPADDLAEGISTPGYAINYQRPGQ